MDHPQAGNSGDIARQLHHCAPLLHRSTTSYNADTSESRDAHDKSIHAHGAARMPHAPHPTTPASAYTPYVSNPPTLQSRAAAVEWSRLFSPQNPRSAPQTLRDRGRSVFFLL